MGTETKKRETVALGVTEARQGDVYIFPAEDACVTGPVPKDPRGLVLAEGETSGHHHAVFGRGHKLFMRAAGDRLLVVTGGGALLRVVGGEVAGVPRHHEIRVAPGKFVVRTQRTWTTEYGNRAAAD